MHATDDWDPAADLGAFISDLHYDDVPATATDAIERAIVDTVGVTLAGMNEGAGQRALAAAGDSDCRDGVPVVGTDMQTSAAEAAFLTGTSAHTLDYDDYTYAYPLHPSVAIVPPILSLLGHRDIDGRDAIVAYTAGFETLSTLTAPISSSHYQTGWHATGTFGVFAAAATAASLLDLAPAEIQHALHIAASTASGLRRNFGTDTKPMHAGQASRSGVTAALLAEQEFSAEAHALTGEGGFYDLYCGRDELDLDAVPTFGEPFGTVREGVNTKLYPSCGATHSSISAVSKLVETAGIAPETIDSITVEIAPFGRDALRYTRPETGAEAKFSLEHCVAAAACLDRVGLDAFENNQVERKDVHALRERVDVAYDDFLAYNDHRSTVTVVTTDGQRHTETVPHPPGTPANPLSADELRTKFRECAIRRLSGSAVSELYENLQTLRDADSLKAALAPSLGLDGDC
ncbi:MULTISPECIES: MmgE/PrpD family protein [Salinibaculum]|uniref:MmgE/PrpD family protein n=1 Tax=Salinibaculum TaxID=2732368 RepID=UPI0030CCD05A